MNHMKALLIYQDVCTEYLYLEWSHNNSFTNTLEQGQVVKN